MPPSKKKAKEAKSVENAAETQPKKFRVAKWLVACGILVVLGAVAFLYSFNRGVQFPLLRDGKNPADLVICRAKVFTADPQNPWAQAVAVKYGRVAYVGNDKGLANFIGPNTQVIDARGKMLTPGFVDNHCHVLWIGALRPLLVSLFEAKNFEETKTFVAEFAAKNKDNPFVLGIGWRYANMPGGKPDKKLLDAIVADRPVFLWSLDGGTGWVNTTALERMQERNPRRMHQLGPALDEKGEPTGLFYAFHGFNPFDYFYSEELPEKFDEKLFAGMKDILAEALSCGVTTLNDAQLPESFIPTVMRFQARGGLEKVRVRGLLYVDHHAMENERQLRAALRRWKAFGAAYSNSHLWLGDGVKLYADGVLGAQTAALLEPYANKNPEKGALLWSQEDFSRAVAIADSLGLQVCTHAVGDRAVRLAVNGYEDAIRLNESQDARHRIEHCELPTVEDQARMAKLGIQAAMQPTHFYSDPDVEAALGEARLARLMPWASMQKAGIPISYGSDWMAGPINPLYGILLASTRLNYKMERNWGPEEKISIPKALRHWTIDSARALRREKEVGSIEVGKYADLVLFDIDLRKLKSWWFLFRHPAELGAWDDFVICTVVGGKIVYCRPGARL